MMKLKNAVIGGTRVIISIENLEPIIVYDLNRNKSPKTNPTRPESDSHNQFSALASNGRRKPLLMSVNALRKANPIKSLSIFTATDPILLLADSKESEVTVQKKAVRSAANSPR
jgi:hypothetical protein